MTEAGAIFPYRGMGQAGKALKQVLERYGISQNKLAVKFSQID
jgi:hypothetical protein